MVLVVKNSAVSTGDIREMGLIAGLKDPEEDKAVHSSILVWRIVQITGDWQSPVHEVAKSQTT